MDGGGGGDGGFDHGHDHGDHGHDHSHDHGSSPSQGPMWSQAMQGLKLSDFFANIKITPNHLLLFMFLAFTGWLGVIYWIRHNEPMANHLVGSGPAYSPTGYADRALIAGAREALPVKTTASSGMVYTPGQANAVGYVNNLAPHSAVASSYASAMQMQQAQPSARQISAMNTINQPAVNRSGIGQPSPSTASLTSIFSSALGGAAGSDPSAMGGGMPSARTFGRHAQAQSPQGQVQGYIQPPAPVQAGWNLSTGGFSSDSAHFNTQFGAPSSSSGETPALLPQVVAPLEPGLAPVAPMHPAHTAAGAPVAQPSTHPITAPPLANGVYHAPVTTNIGTRLRMFTNR
jgi:hypothetical protein